MKAVSLLSGVVLGVSVSVSASVADMGAARAARSTGTSLALWSTPELIQAIPATTIEGRLISGLTAPAFDASGDAFIVWTEPMGAPSEAVAPGFRVRATWRPSDGRWQPVETISHMGLNPEVTVDVRGDVIAAWEGRFGVEAAIKPVGGGWLAPQTVGTPRGEEPQEPQVASDASGDAIVVAPPQAQGQASAGIQGAIRPDCLAHIAISVTVRGVTLRDTSASEMTNPPPPLTDGLGGSRASLSADRLKSLQLQTRDRASRYQ